jgi:predicted deacylase
MMGVRCIYPSLLAVLFFAAPVSSKAAPPLRYYTTGEINSWMKNLADNNRSLTRYTPAGMSSKGQEIGILAIGHGTSPDGMQKPAIIINAAHHGDEKISTAAALHLIETLIRSAEDLPPPSDPVWASALDRYTFHIQPVVNPDGYRAGTREDAFDRDLNRDYAYPGRNESQSFKAPETRVVRDYLSQLDVRAALALHAGTEGVLWPWCHTSEPPWDAPELMRLAWSAARAMDTSARQSWHDYPSSGEFTDYIYWQRKVPALTLEVHKRKKPHASQIPAITSRTTRAIREFTRELMKNDQSARELVINNSIRR